MSGDYPVFIPRRNFLKKAAATGAAALAWPWSHFAEKPAASQGMQYRTLGRTGLRISEVGFGGYPTKDPNVVRHAVECGINYFDTAACYTGGVSERTIGEGLEGRRDKVVITTKWHPGATTSSADMLDTLNESLKRLRTDYVDCLLVHEVGGSRGEKGIDRLRNPELFRAMEKAKEQGKARFFGCSGHAGNLMAVMNYAITVPEFSIILCRHNFMSYPEEADLFRRAKEAGVGVVAMKTLSGARGRNLASFRDKDSTFKQAALKWVLSNRDISGLVISMFHTRQVEEYIQASGSPMTAADDAALQEYAALFGHQVCRMCGVCEGACDRDVRVSDILRYRMYEHEYGMVGEGKRLYRQNAARHFANACASCAAPCLATCPHGIDIPRELQAAHELLV